jgi:hypothetical protein
MKENLFIRDLKTGIRYIPWFVTNVSLVMRVLNNGLPGGLYLLKAGTYWDDESELIPGDPAPPSRGLTNNEELWTVAEITNMDHHDLKLYYDGIIDRVIEINPISETEIDIANAGIRGEWTEDIPPLGQGH